MLRLNSSLPHCTAGMFACSATATPGTSSSARESGNTRADQQRAAGGAMKARAPIRLARLHDVERHHAADHRVPGSEPRPEPIDVADAVLQADHDGAGRRMPGDEIGHLLRGPALDGDQDDVGRAKAAAGSLVSSTAPAASARSPPSRPEMRMPWRPMSSARAGLPQERHAAPRQRQAAADVAADAPGPRHGDDGLRGLARAAPGGNASTCIIVHSRLPMRNNNALMRRAISLRGLATVH